MTLLSLPLYNLFATTFPLTLLQRWRRTQIYLPPIVSRTRQNFWRTFFPSRFDLSQRGGQVSTPRPVPGKRLRRQIDLWTESVVLVIAPDVQPVGSTTVSVSEDLFETRTVSTYGTECVLLSRCTETEAGIYSLVRRRTQYSWFLFLSFSMSCSFTLLTHE